MTERFLQWKLPADFNPDAGIGFSPVVNLGTEHQYRHEPIGTNLFSYTQAEAMVRHMLEGAALSPTVSEADGLAGEIMEIIGHSRPTDDCILPGPMIVRILAALSAQPTGDATKSSCATCGKDVAEVLCPACAKWWADNPPAGDATDAEGVLREVVARYFGVTVDQFDTVKRDLVPIEDAVLATLVRTHPPKPEAIAGEGVAAIKAHVRHYDTPKDDDPRRCYTEAQLETAIRLARTSQANEGEIERLARAFVAKLDECQPYIDSAFFHMTNHGMGHTGPQYGEELEALRQALSPSPDTHDRSGS